MKKRLLCILAVALIIVMESVTVFATEGSASPTGATAGISGSSGSTGTSDDSSDTDDDTDDNTDGVATGTTVDNNQYLYGDLIMLNGEGTTLRLYRLTTDGDEKTESNNVVIGMITVNDSNITELLSDEDYALARQKLLELADIANENGYDLDGIAFNVTSSDTDVVLNLIDSRVVATDKAEGLVMVYHLLSDGTCEEPYFESYDGGVTVHFKNGFSPVLIVKYTKQTDYSQKPTATISGNTSPKTAEVDSLAIIITIVSIALIIICTKKISKN